MRDLIIVAWDWGVRCFGADHMNNHKIRALRAAEEVIELAQALGVPQDTILKLVSTVYSRPPGSALQEIGGSMVTLVVLCRALEIDPTDAFVTELRRCLAKDPAHFAKRNQDKIDMGLDA